MPITRHRDAPYWPHSDPSQPRHLAAVPDSAAPTPGPASIAAAIAQLAADVEVACPGECNSDWRSQTKANVGRLERAVRHTEPGEQAKLPTLDERLAVTPGRPIWCPGCAALIASDLGRLPDLAVAAANLGYGRLAPAPVPPDGRHATVTDPPSPSPAYDHVDRILRWTAAWADKAARHLGEDDPALYLPDGLPARTLTRTSRYLIHRLTPILCADQLAKDFGREVRDLAAYAEKVAGRDRPIYRLDEPCFACGRVALSRRDGAGKVTCGYCGRAWPEENFEFLARAATS